LFGISKHIFTKSYDYQKSNYVDSAGLDKRTFTLPREISTTTSWLCREVSRSHSTCRKRATQVVEVSQARKDRTLNVCVNLIS